MERLVSIIMPVYVSERYVTEPSESVFAVSHQEGTTRRSEKYLAQKAVRYCSQENRKANLSTLAELMGFSKNLIMASANACGSSGSTR